MIDDFMDRAILQSKLASELQEVPVGAVVVYKQSIIAESHNLVLTNMDPTAHAEILVLRKAGQSLGSAYLVGCDLYVTLEPCPMCAQAISLARIRRLYFGAYDYKSGGVVNGPCIYHYKSAHHKPEIYDGIQAEKTKKIMQDFFMKLRA